MSYNDILGFVVFSFAVVIPICSVFVRSLALLLSTRSAWSMDQGSTRKRSAVHNLGPTVTKFCVMWEGLSLPHDTKFRNCRGEIVARRMIFILSLIHGSGWSGLIKAEPGPSQCKDTVLQVFCMPYGLYIFLPTTKHNIAYTAIVSWEMPVFLGALSDMIHV